MPGDLNAERINGLALAHVRDDRPAGEDTAPAVWFAYSEDRKGEHPRQHLKNFKGGLQADAYAGFHHLYGDGGIYEVAPGRMHAASFTRSMLSTPIAPSFHTTDLPRLVGILIVLLQFSRGSERGSNNCRF